MAVIGAGNAAAQGILFVARYARCVNVLIRGLEPTWSKYLDVAIRSNPKIQLMFNTELTDVIGDEAIQANGQGHT